MSKKIQAVQGFPPKACNICHKPLTDVVIDGRLKGRTSWGWMCSECWKLHGVGQLGLGHGQKYVRTPKGQWIKIVEPITIYQDGAEFYDEATGTCIYKAQNRVKDFDQPAALDALAEFRAWAKKWGIELAN
jgi:hypothetical protein